MTILAVVPEQTAPDVLPPSLLAHTAELIREFTLDWRLEVPNQIHSAELDGDGTPAFHPDFINYIDRPCRREGCFDPNCRHGLKTLHPDNRVRVSRAFRRLRNEAPREFDVLYLICRHGMTLKDVAAQMTERSTRLGLNQRYNEDGVIVLAVSAAHKVEQWY